MSVFWKYFHETLAWPWIFRPGPLSVLIKGLAHALDEAQADIVWLRDQFAVTRAEARMIPGYGASRGIPRTRYDSDEKYRTRVERAFVWHKKSGKIEGLPHILAEYGYPGGMITHYAPQNPELWAHFGLHLLTPPHTWGQPDIDAVYDLAQKYKPARSVLDAVSFALRQRAPLTLGASQRAVVTFNHSVIHGSSAFPPAPLRLGVAPVLVITFTHSLEEAP